MEIFLDTADINQIRERWDTGLITGITTNPTLAKKVGRPYRTVIEEICEEFPELNSISVEIPGNTYEELMQNFPMMGNIHGAVTLKLPCTRAGLKVCKHASDNGVPTNVTLVFSAAQAVLVALAGATYISPFVGRMNDNSLSGVELVRAIGGLYKSNGVQTKVLAASLRDAHHVSRSLLYGADVVTLPPSTFDKMYDHVLTREGLSIFDEDFKSVEMV